MFIGYSMTEDQYCKPNPAAQPDFQFAKFSVRGFTLEQIRHMRHRRARNVFRCGVFVMHTRREVKACLAKKVLDKGGAKHRTFAR
jgi:hypothetical protein